MVLDIINDSFQWSDTASSANEQEVVALQVPHRIASAIRSPYKQGITFADGCECPGHVANLPDVELDIFTGIRAYRDWAFTDAWYGHLHELTWIMEDFHIDCNRKVIARLTMKTNHLVRPWKVRI